MVDRNIKVKQNKVHDRRKKKHFLNIKYRTGLD